MQQKTLPVHRAALRGTLVRYAALVNPTGHLPISFAVLNHTAAVHPTVEVPLHWMAGALLRRLATDLHPSEQAAWGTSI